MALLAPSTITASQVVNNTVNIVANSSQSDIERTGLAIYRKNSPWVSGNQPSAGIEVAYVEGTGAISATREERLAFGTYYYAAFNVNKITNEFSTFVTTGAVTSPAPSNPIYNLEEINLPVGTHYYSVHATNHDNATRRLDFSPITVGASSTLPIIATSFIAEYVGGGSVRLTLTNPADISRTQAKIYRKESAWSSNDITGATLVSTIPGSGAGTTTIFDNNVLSGTYYYAVLNENSIGNVIRREALPVTFINKQQIDRIAQLFSGSPGVPLDSPWVVRNSTLAATASAVTLGDNSARIRVGKASSATEGFYTLEYDKAFNLDFLNENDGRVLYLEHDHPSGEVEIDFYITDEHSLTNPATANKYVLLRYNTIGSANGTTTVVVKNGSTTNTRATFAHGAGTTTSSVFQYLLFAGDTIRATVKNRLGTETSLTLSANQHPFTSTELKNANVYIRVRRTQDATTDVILRSLYVFQNLGPALANVQVTPLKSDNSQWFPGEATGLYVKTRYSATLPPDNPSLPIEYVVRVDDVDLSPRPTTLPVIYDEALTLDISHTVSIRSKNRSPFAVLFSDAPIGVQIPTIAVDGPENGASISNSITFNALSSVSGGVREVRWYVGNRLVKVDTTAPYTYTLNPSLFTTGVYEFKVISVGMTGGTNSVTRNYTLVGSGSVDNTGPIATLFNLNELDNITISRDVYLEVEDPSGIQKVEFLMDSNILAIVSSPAYQVSINPASFASGSYIFEAKVYDNSNNVTTITRNITITPPVVIPGSDIKGDTNNAETSLRSRNDVIWYGSMDGSPNWHSSWFMEGTPTNAANAAVTQTNALDGNALRVKYPGGSQNCFAGPRYPGGGGTTPGGIKGFTDISTMGTPDQEELYLRYYFRFDAGFSFVGGGKLPGLAGGTRPHECTPAWPSTGWSGLHAFRPRGLLSVFLYTDAIGASTKRDCGFERFFRINGKMSDLLTPGKWHCLEARYKMNTPGQADGVYQGWLDGELGLTLNNVKYRPTGETFRIDTLIMGTWFGGNGCNWYPRTAQHIQFDSFVLAKNPIGTRDGS